jgi:hypothetical protein
MNHWPGPFSIPRDETLWTAWSFVSGVERGLYRRVIRREMNRNIARVRESKW